MTTTSTIVLSDYQKETITAIENGLKEAGIKKFRLGTLNLSSKDILEVVVCDPDHFVAARNWLLKNRHKCDTQKPPEEGNLIGYLYVTLEKNQ